MAKIVDSIIDGVDTLLAWFTTVTKQTVEAYCDLQTADSNTSLVANDGSLVSIAQVVGIKDLVGAEEFDRVLDGLSSSLRSNFERGGHSLQVSFLYDKSRVKDEIKHVFEPAVGTCKRLELDLADLFVERTNNLARYCTHEEVYLVFWTKPNLLNADQLKRMGELKQEIAKQDKLPPFEVSQNLMATITDLREGHDSFVQSVLNDLTSLGVVNRLLEVHDAVRAVRKGLDPEFTSEDWRPLLPGDQIPLRVPSKFNGNLTDIMWPSLSSQLLPRGGEVLDLRTARLGDRIYSCIYIDIFPSELQRFAELMQRIMPMNLPWKISFMIDGDGMDSLRLKSMFSSILSWSSQQNRLINGAVDLLKYIKLHGEDAVVRVRVSACTWAGENELELLRVRTSQLAQAIEGWGSCNVTEISGDPFGGLITTSMGISADNYATSSVAPLRDVVYMLPMFRPASPWEQGAILFRSIDGKLWPYQPGSSKQTTWIDLIYARPGSGKSVLSNAINLALCLAGGLQRLPRIAIIDIGPSSSGLISLLKEALPEKRRHLVAYHRLNMTVSSAINPFDTQLGCRYPTPQERSFLINFMVLLVTPIGAEYPYDGMSDMAGLVVDELYKRAADDGTPNTYTRGVDLVIDQLLDKLAFAADAHTTWWEVTDALFLAGFVHEAIMAQRYAVPLLAESASICRSNVVEDLYGKIVAPTGESLINAFARMISAAVREYPVLSQPTCFDLGEARVVALDLDEVAKSGGDAADRQTAVMYMLARYVMVRDYYLTTDLLADLPEAYRNYHENRINEIREDLKRIVYDEFHRTSKSRAVREQVVVDMREGRKWKVQIALLSQSVEDFDAVMVEFATSIFIMDAGPEQSVRKTAQIFGLSQTAQHALRNYVHGPGKGGANFLAQFATKEGNYVQLLTSTLGPVELWAFTTTAEDSILRGKLYQQLGPHNARVVLARLFPSGSAFSYLEGQLTKLKHSGGVIDEELRKGVIDSLAEGIIQAYAKDPNFTAIPQ